MEKQKKSLGFGAHNNGFVVKTTNYNTKVKEEQKNIYHCVYHRMKARAILDDSANDI